MLALIVLVSVLLLLGLITIVKMHPFIALLVVSFFVGVCAGMPLVKISDSIQAGFGGTLGFVGIVLGLGTVLGKLLEESGGAERIARTLIAAFGPTRVQWAMYAVAFIVGIPMFFQVGFVLLIPLVYTVTKEFGVPALRVGLAMLAGLSVVHGVLPPHPAALAVVAIFHADIGRTIIYGILVGVPSSMIAGPIFATWIAPKFKEFSETKMIEMAEGTPKPETPPGFVVSLFTIMLPVILLVFATYADLYLDPSTSLYSIFKFIGNPITALLIACLVACYTFGLAVGMSPAKILKHSDTSFMLIASILLIIGAGGAFSRVLIDSGAGTDIANRAQALHVDPLVFGWIVSTLIRVATGSATVAMTTAGGIVAPLVIQAGVSPELMVVAVGGGALMLSHVNDAGFWMIKEYFGLSLKLTFQTWTVLETILGTSVLVFTLLLEWALRLR
ncbi:MAG TPA: gluconate:H+ symporter [Vicinamibacterales bacterium]|jgi:GntP family gluconate:H+ symporter|nr:gluconate:H+ symporter [Vicinamibacterales bacterium]